MYLSIRISEHAYYIVPLTAFQTICIYVAKKNFSAYNATADANFLPILRCDEKDDFGAYSLPQRIIQIWMIATAIRAYVAGLCVKSFWAYSLITLLLCLQLEKRSNVKKVR